MAPLVTPTTATDPAITVPVVGITAADGVMINNRLASGPVTLTRSCEWISSPTLASGGRIAANSSCGTSPDLTLKPDIGATGRFIRSTFPLEWGGSFFGNGTSFAEADACLTTQPVVAKIFFATLPFVLTLRPR